MYKPSSRGVPAGFFDRKELAMANETQNTVAGVTATTEEKVTQADATKVAPYVYYYSDPDETNPLLHHLPIPSFIDLSDLIKQGKLWKIYDIPAPDNSMEDPVIDLKTNSWVENGKNAQTKILAQATQAIDSLKAKGEELDQAHSEVDQAVKAMQQVQAQSSQQIVAMMKSFTEQTQNTNKMLAIMQQTLALVVKAVQNSAVPEAPAQSSTNEQENGGN